MVISVAGYSLNLYLTSSSNHMPLQLIGFQHIAVYKDKVCKKRHIVNWNMCIVMVSCYGCMVGKLAPMMILNVYIPKL